jgi:hypothetical protein
MALGSGGAIGSPSPVTTQSLTHPLPHPVPELARCQHLDVRHPGENPARQFLATRGLQAELQRAVPALPQFLARVPHLFANIGGAAKRCGASATGGWHRTWSHGGRASHRHPAEIALQAVARPHLARLACGPAALPRLSKPDALTAVVDDPRVVEKILRHLGAWHDRPPKPPPRALRGPARTKPVTTGPPSPRITRMC